MMVLGRRSRQRVSRIGGANPHGWPRNGPTRRRGRTPTPLGGHSAAEGYRVLRSWCRLRSRFRASSRSYGGPPRAPCGGGNCKSRRVGERSGSADGTLTFERCFVSP